MKKVNRLTIFAVLTLVLGMSGYAFGAESSQEDGALPAKGPSHREVVIKPVKGVASGVAEVGKAPGKLVAETVKETTSKPPIEGTVEGVGKGASELVKSTVRGTYKIATLGYGKVDQVDVENPKTEQSSIDPGEKKPTRFKIRIPGT